MDTNVPEFLPVLSRGAHRKPEDGACFMEYCSFLAGENFDDHPACVHTEIARVGRNLNDYAPVDKRNLLLDLIPYVMGTNIIEPGSDLDFKVNKGMETVSTLCAFASWASAFECYSALLKELNNILDRTPQPLTNDQLREMAELTS